MIDVDRLYREHHAYIVGLLRNRMPPGDEDVEDLAQQVFLKAWEHADSYRDRGISPRYWLSRIAMNLVVDHYRQQHSSKGTHLNVNLDAVRSLAEAIPDPEAAYERAEARAEIDPHLDALTAKQRRVIEARFFRSESVKAAAASAGVTVEGCKKLQARGLDRMRREMSDVQIRVIDRPTLRAKKTHRQRGPRESRSSYAACVQCGGPFGAYFAKGACSYRCYYLMNRERILEINRKNALISYRRRREQAA